jgi:hypothetical protein
MPRCALLAEAGLRWLDGSAKLSPERHNGDSSVWMPVMWKRSSASKS